MAISRLIRFPLLYCLLMCAVAQAIQFSDEALAKLAQQQSQQQANNLHDAADALAKRLSARLKQQPTEVPLSHYTPSLEPHSLVAAQIKSDNTDSAITVLACLFAAIKVYQRYQLMYVPIAAQERSYMQRSLAYICPQFIQGLAVKGTFCIDVCAIACETVLYKSLSKFFVACCTRDLTDLMQDTLIQIKKSARAIIFT